MTDRNKQAAIRCAYVMLVAAGCSWFDDLEPRPPVPPIGNKGSGGNPMVDPPDSSHGGSGQGSSGRDAGLDESADVVLADVEGGFEPDGDADADDVTDATPTDDAGTKPPVVGTTWHPEARRMAITDESSEPDTQHRVWALVHGGQTPHRLVTKSVVDSTTRWRDTGIYDITTDPDAISFTEPAGQRQRIFFGRNGKLAMYRVDMRDSGTLVELPPPSEYTIGTGDVATGDVAAVTFVENGTRRIAVLAPAKRQETPGHYCIFENANSAEQWTTIPSSEPGMAELTDVVGVEVGGQVRFYFRSLDNRLSSLRRVGVGSYELESIPLMSDQPIGPSLVAIPSWLKVGNVDLAVISEATGRVRTATLSVDSGADASASAASAWTERPALPGGAVPARGHAALTGVWVITEPSEPQNLVLYVVDSAGGIHSIGNKPVTGWYPDWSSPLVPAGGQIVHAIGASWPAPPFYGTRLPALILSSGGQIATTFQPFLDVFVRRFLDNLRPQPTPVEALEGDFAEVSLAMGPDNGLAAASQRNDLPWQVVLDSTIDGASSWGADQKLVPSPARDPIDLPAASALNPSAAYGGGWFHLLDQEIDLPKDCSSPETRASRVVYRRGPSAAAIAGATPPDRFVMTQGDRQEYPSLLVTEEAGRATAHVLYTGANEVFYWKLPPGPDSSPSVTPVRTGFVSPGPSVLLKGPGNIVYGGTTNAGTLMLCRFDVVPVLAAACTLVQGISNPLEIPFGTEKPQQQGACPPVDGQYFKCLIDERPFALVANPSEPNQIFLVYAAPDQGETAIFFTRSVLSEGGDSFAWTQPIRIHDKPANDHRYYFDPEIADSGNGTVLITYSAMTAAPGASNRVDTYRASTSDAGKTFTITPLTYTWDPERLNFDCTIRKWRIGDYHTPSTVGARALFPFRSLDGTRARLETRWLSHWTMDELTPMGP